MYIIDMFYQNRYGCSAWGNHRATDPDQVKGSDEK